MATLARDLLGVQAEFNRLGQTTTEDAYTLFLDPCRRSPVVDGMSKSGNRYGIQRFERTP
jgi:hypothetical protein